MKEKTLKTCEKGHKFHKKSDCPVCPICEEEKKPKDGFLSLISSPARRALENSSIVSLEELSNYSEIDIMKLHGIGKSAIPILQAALNREGLSFKK